jgi:hypothetical protein
VVDYRQIWVAAEIAGRSESGFCGLTLQAAQSLAQLQLDRSLCESGAVYCCCMCCCWRMTFVWRQSWCLLLQLLLSCEA